MEQELNKLLDLLNGVSPGCAAIIVGLLVLASRAGALSWLLSLVRKAKDEAKPADLKPAADNPWADVSLDSAEPVEDHVLLARLKDQVATEFNERTLVDGDDADDVYVKLRTRLKGE